MAMTLEIVSAIVGVIGTLLVTYKNKIGFLLWMVGNSLWMIYGAITGQYFFMGQYVVYTGLAVFGFVKWFKDDVLDKKLNKKNNRKRK